MARARRGSGSGCLSQARWLADAGSACQCPFSLSRELRRRALPPRQHVARGMTWCGTASESKAAVRRGAADVVTVTRTEKKKGNGRSRNEAARVCPLQREGVLRLAWPCPGTDRCTFGGQVDKWTRRGEKEGGQAAREIMNARHLSVPATPSCHVWQAATPTPFQHALTPAVYSTLLSPASLSLRSPSSCFVSH